MAKDGDILSKDPAEIEALAERLERGQLREGDRALAAKMLRLLLVVVRLLERKRATIFRRLFGGWDFSRKRPGDLARMPTDLKRRLLEHALASADEDKRQRARRAFGP
jgi:hypothetical protein